MPPEAAARRIATRPTVAASLLLEAGLVDAAICGGSGNWMNQWHYAFDVIGKRPDVGRVYALSAVIIPSGTLFFVDTHLLVEPTAEQIAENVKAFVQAVNRAKPSGAKGTYVKKISLSSTMGPGVSVDVASAVAGA